MSHLVRIDARECFVRWGREFSAAGGMYDEASMGEYNVMMMSMTKCIAGEGVGGVD